MQTRNPKWILKCNTSLTGAFCADNVRDSGDYLRKTACRTSGWTFCVRPAWAWTNGVQVPCRRTYFVHYLWMIITTSRRQLQFCEVLWEGSPSAKRRAYVQECHRRLSLRGKLAQDNKTHWFARHSKWQGSVVTVHVLIWGDLFNKQWTLLFENVSWATAINVLATWWLSIRIRANFDSNAIMIHSACLGNHPSD